MADKIDEILERFDQLTLDERTEVLQQLLVLRAKDTVQATVTPKRSVLDGFKERGMIGSITDAPPDWSTNPKYMEGFGQHAE